MIRRSGTAPRAERPDPGKPAQGVHPAERHRDGVLDDQPEKFIFPLNSVLRSSGKEDTEEIAPGHEPSDAERPSGSAFLRREERLKSDRGTAGMPDSPRFKSISAEDSRRLNYNIINH
jgi:hypothetical protein